MIAALFSMISTNHLFSAIIKPLTPTTNLVFVMGDITKFEASQEPVAIVNAAQPSLRCGGGVCGAIFNAVGYEKLTEECQKHPILRNNIRCQVGQARYTKPCGNFAEKNIAVIHAVGPDCRIQEEENNKKKLLEEAYYNSLLVAEENSILKIAFPAISTAIYEYDNKEANPVALAAIVKYFNEHPESKIQTVYLFSYNPTDGGEKDFRQYQYDAKVFFEKKK